MFEFYWLPKVTSTLSKRSTECNGGCDNNKVYVKIIDSFYVIVTARRKVDGFKWYVISTLFTLCYGWTSVRWGEVMKEGLEANHAKRHWEEISKMRERMEANYEKRTRDAVEQVRTIILNNGSAGGTNDTVPDLSMPSPMSE